MVKVHVRKNTGLLVQKKHQSRLSSRTSIAKKVRININLHSYRRSYHRMLRYLALTGYRINSNNSRGETALHVAVKCDDIEAASQLVQLGADVDRKNLRGETPLHVAVVNWSHADVLAEIVPNGNGNLYRKMRFYGLDSMNCAVEGRDQDALDTARFGLVKMLLDAGAEVNAKDNHGCSPLQCAIYSGDLELVTMLIDAGANVNNENTMRATPLHDAVLCCNEAMVRLLLSRGANVAVKTMPGFSENTALNWASILNIGNSHDGIIGKLLEFGSDLNEENSYSMTPFNHIVESSDVNLVKLCIDEYKADLKQLASDGRNALAFAVLNLNENVMDLVLESGIEIDRKSRIGQTPLILASEMSMLENVRRLISLGADVNTKDARDFTPLAACVRALSERVYFVERWPLVVDRTNFREERRQVIRLLLNCGSDLNQRVYTFLDPQRQPTIMQMVASEEEDYETLNVVIEHVAEMEAKLNKPLLDDYNQIIFDEMLEEDPKIKSHYQKCQAELTTMRTAKIEGTTISYFSVLTEPLDVVARYARNEDFVKAFEAGDYKSAYDSYASKLEEKFVAATTREKMMEQASNILSATLKFADSSHPAFELILEDLTEANVKILIGST